MSIKTLEYLPGISSDDCRRLRTQGIGQTNRLLHAATLETDRDRLSRRTGISAVRLLEFARQCAMLEISSMEPHLAQLHRLGYTGLKQMKSADPATLHAALIEVVGLNRAPSRSQVEYWISQARYQDCLEEPGQLTASQTPS
ncbi:MAG TPA: DUF4332 domain-containing protein [Candidatus Nitrosotalea sp.]|nr:DUF4332 domain-containing protein [Candidatus Nitrosotalea sp.]